LNLLEFTGIFIDSIVPTKLIEKSKNLSSVSFDDLHYW